QLLPETAGKMKRPGISARSLHGADQPSSSDMRGGGQGAARARHAGARHPRREAPQREAAAQREALRAALPREDPPDADGGASCTRLRVEQLTTARSEGAVGLGGPAVLGGVLRRLAPALPRSEISRWTAAGRAGEHLAAHHRLAVPWPHRVRRDW